ncbi:50S ribosomal protein L32 [Patescibacteria group bacterium]|nr:50S ribosomal protein L32 [Patescibacteria group bacterium]MCH8889366.1 50S ribosomal protein L32 [Patescibacteria group bacterium]
MSVRMRANRSHTKNRRSHHHVNEPRLSTCSDCKSMHLRHHVCETCGKYRGRLVVDVIAKAQKRQDRLKRRGEESVEQKQAEVDGETDKDKGSQVEEETEQKNIDKKLDPATLSQK